MNYTTKEEAMDQDISKALKYDPLSEAERMTGADYKTSEDTMKMGMALNFIHGRHKNALLENSDDTTLNTETGRYIRIAQEIGFKEISCEDFKAGEREEKNYTFWHEGFGILLHFDTYGKNVNGGNFYYNWLPNPDLKDLWSITSSGGITIHEENRVWVGSHDCREALRFHIKNLSDNGAFLNKWIDRPFLWLLNYSDTKKEGYDYKEINAVHLKEMPAGVLKAITPNQPTG